MDASYEDLSGSRNRKKHNRKHNKSGGRGSKLRRDELRDLKSKSKCLKCGKVRLWSEHHMPVGSIPQNTPSAKQKDNTLHFGMAFMTPVDTATGSTPDAEVDNQPIPNTFMPVVSACDTVTEPTDVLMTERIGYDGSVNTDDPIVPDITGLNNSNEDVAMTSDNCLDNVQMINTEDNVQMFDTEEIQHSLDVDITDVDMLNAFMNDDMSIHNSDIDMIENAELSLAIQSLESPNSFNTLNAATISLPNSDEIMTSSSCSTVPRLGPIVDDGAPYSSIGSTELQLLRGSKTLDLDPLPEVISDFKFWQFGFVAHASFAKPILGSAMLQFKYDQGRPLKIHHIIVE